jgi:hypothetical protein
MRLDYEIVYDEEYLKFLNENKITNNNQINADSFYNFALELDLNWGIN